MSQQDSWAYSQTNGRETVIWVRNGEGSQKRALQFLWEHAQMIEYRRRAWATYKGIMTIGMRRCCWKTRVRWLGYGCYWCEIIIFI